MRLSRPQASAALACLLISVAVLAVAYQQSLLGGGVDRNERPHASPQPKFRLANVMGKHMVLQRSPAKSRVWGWCSGVGCAEDMLVTVGQHTVSGTKRKGAGSVSEEAWEVLLPPFEAGGPWEMTVALHGEVRVLGDILFGDVFIFTGQSNMQFSTALSQDNSLFTGAKEHKTIRLLTAGVEGNAWKDEPAKEVPHLLQTWSSPSFGALGGKLLDEEFPEYFSAVAWNFALYQQQSYPDVPIGLVVSAANGAAIQTMSPPQALIECADVLPDPTEAECCPWKPGTMWNGMLHPLAPMVFAGTLFYQGESNVLTNDYYNCAFPAFVTAWRDIVGRDDPFVFAMIHPFPYIVNDVVYLPRMRAQQLEFARALPGTAIAVTTDLGDHLSPAGSLHPRNKTMVARRMADAMQRLREGRPAEPPQFTHASTGVVLGTPAVRLHSNTPITLAQDRVSCPSGRLAGEPWEKYCASLLIQAGGRGWMEPTDVLLSDDAMSAVALTDVKSVDDIVAVRYCVADWPVPVFFDADGVPLVQFDRTL